MKPSPFDVRATRKRLHRHYQVVKLKLDFDSAEILGYSTDLEAEMMSSRNLVARIALR